MPKKLSSTQLLLTELKALMERCNLTQKSLATFLYEHGEEYVSEDKEFIKVYNLIRKQLSQPPQDLSIFRRYIEILRENHPTLKKDIRFPKIVPEFDNEIDQLRFDKMMEKINNMDK